MIFSSDEQDKKIQQLLKQSRQDFRFDPTLHKMRLLNAMAQEPQITPHPVRLRIWHTFEFGVALAAMILFVSATFVFAGNSQPGDTFFPLNKLSEKVILSLPMPAQQKAQVQAQIVTKRLQALDQVENDNNRVIETVKESDESLSNAIETVSVKRDGLEAAGNDQAAQHLDEVLGQLEDLAQQHEQRIEHLRQNAQNETMRSELNVHLLQVKQSRHKALKELKRQIPDESDSD